LRGVPITFVDETAIAAMTLPKRKSVTDPLMSTFGRRVLGISVAPSA
jgi:hypothetical protein